MQITRETISYLIGQRIHALRKDRRISQEELALASEIHPAYLGRVERGEKCPTVQTLYKISEGLKVPLHELTNVSEEIHPTNTEAVQRIQTALSDLSDADAVRIAEIVEGIAALTREKHS